VAAAGSVAQAGASAAREQAGSAGVASDAGTPHAVLGIMANGSAPDIERWLGVRIGATATWNDGFDWTFAHQSTLKDPFEDNRADGLLLDLVAAIWKDQGQSWSAAASDPPGGSYDAFWTTAVQAMRTSWGNRDPADLYVAFARDFNVSHSSIQWSVSSDEVEAFIAAWRRFHGIFKRELPGARLVWCPTSFGNLLKSLDTAYPGSDYVDVIGVTTNDDGFADFESLLTASNGLDRFQQFALREGKPLAICSWSVDAQNPNFATAFTTWLLDNRGVSAGQVALAIYNDWATTHCAQGNSSAACDALKAQYNKHLR
jgi:hypothetical protein